jgi:GNAT superfamily N-acetyltransferase
VRPRGRWFIGRLMVVPDRQRQGIGSVLMEAIEGAAPAGTEAYALFTGAASAATLSYYRRRSYVEIERRVTDDGVPVVVLERPVS